MESDIDTQAKREIEEEAKKALEAKDEELAVVRHDFAQLQIEMARERSDTMRDMIELRESLGEEAKRSSSLREEVVRVEAKLEEVTREKESLQREVEAIAKQMEDIQSLFNTQAEEQAQTEQNLRQQLTELEAVLATSRAKAETAAKQHQERLDAALAQAKRDGEARMRQLEHELDDVASVRKGLEAQLAEKIATIASLQAEVDVRTASPFALLRFTSDLP
jgi:chromosome segregation ATPase